MLETIATRTIYTVSQLNRTVRDLLENNFPLLWIEGEISNLSTPASGHYYFSLKDANAQVRCAMFRNRVTQLGFKPKDGMQVLLRAQVGLYEGRGDFQLIVETMEQAGDGALLRAFALLKQTLQQEGLFDSRHKKPLPALPKQIGVITSPTGAAIRDILIVLKRRFPSIPVIIYPTQVQGTQAPLQIVAAIQIANRRSECDVLILARGGGSLEDLWSFNDEKVARAIYASDIPIVTGVGHEVDTTIADFVADQRAATPSAAAELLSPHHAEWLELFSQLNQRLVRQILQLLAFQQHQLTAFSKRLRHPKQRIREDMQRLDHLEHRLYFVMEKKLTSTREQFTHLTRALSTVSPLATLQRGYAIVTTAQTRKILHTVAAVKTGDNVIAQLAEGSLHCTVEKVMLE